MANNLHEITGQESGAILYEDGESIWIGNWSGIQGIPRELAPIGMIGLGEELEARRITASPKDVEEAMLEYAREQGDDSPSKTGFRAWQVNGVTVVTHKDWA